jgi:hypothetical protein
MKRKNWLAWGTALLLALAQAAIAQEITGAITGKVTDPSGAAIVGATVIARDADRGTASRTTTNEVGLYNLARLPIGRYEIRVEASGFQSAVRPAFQLALNQTATVDMTMSIGQVSQTMEVTSAAPVLQTQTTEVGTIMAAQAIASLPLETRN